MMRGKTLKIAQNCTKNIKNCTKMQKNCQKNGNFLTFKWQFFGGPGTQVEYISQLKTKVLQKVENYLFN